MSRLNLTTNISGLTPRGYPVSVVNDLSKVRVEQLYLRAVTDNKYDANAIAVDFCGEQFGWIPAKCDLKSFLWAHLMQGGTFSIAIKGIDESTPRYPMLTLQIRTFSGAEGENEDLTPPRD